MQAPAAERLMRAGVALAVVAVPLAWTTWVSAEYTLPKFLALAAGAALSSAGLALACGQGRSPARRTPLDLPIAAGLAVLALSSGFSQDPLLSLAGRYNSYAYGLWSFLLYAVLFYCAAWAFPGERLRLLALGTAAAEEALRCHPSDVNSHYLAGSATLMKAQLGFSAELAAAAAHYDAALALDPMFRPLLEARLGAARLAGDLPGQARLRERIGRLEALERR